MRTSKIDKNNLILRLKEKYNNNEPIFVDDIILLWGEYSRARAFQILKSLCEEDVLSKHSLGVYFFPEIAFWVAPLPLDAAKIAEKKYINQKNQIIGYYSGLTLPSKKMSSCIRIIFHPLYFPVHFRVMSHVAR